MEFLAALIARLSLPILNWIYEKVGGLITKALLTKRVYELVKTKNRLVREQTEKAKTREEKESALKKDASTW